MADPVVAPEPAAPAAPVVPAEAVALPVAAAAEPAAKLATPPSESAVVAPAEASPPPPPASLLKVQEKPKEVAVPPPETKPKEPAAEAAPPESVTYEPFKLPEGFQPNEKEMSSYVDVLKEFKAPQALGQKLIDFHLAELNKIATVQREAWANTLKTWQDDTKSDPEIGGNR